MRFQKALFLPLAVTFAFVSASCGFCSAQGDSTAARTFTFRIPGEPETLDWNLAHTTIETYLLMNIMEGLVSFDENLKVVPDLAQSWTMSHDGKTYTFKLRKGVKWTDGIPLRAQDFVYSWKRLLSPITAASYAYFLFDIQGAKEFNEGKIQDFGKVGVKALDDSTLQVTLAHPVAHWIDMPTFWVTFPLREDIVEKYGSGWATPGRMVTLGPYMMVSHDLDSKIVLQANPTYYGTRGNIEKIVGLIVKDDSTALSLYDAGQIDFLTDISTVDLTRLSGNPELKSYPYLKVGFLGFVVSRYPLTNIHVRRAIAMAIDKTKLQSILHGGQSPATSVVPPGMMAHFDKIGLPYDPEGAKRELRASGINLTTPIRVDFVTPNWDKQLTLAQFIQEELKKNLGIDVSLQPFDHKTYRAQLDLHTYPLFEGSWSADYPDPDNFLSIFMSDAGNNRSNWKNAKYDNLINSARTLRDSKVREKIYHQAQKILLEDDAVILPLYYEPNMALVRPRVTGLELNPLNYLFLRKVNLGS